MEKVNFFKANLKSNNKNMEKIVELKKMYVESYLLIKTMTLKEIDKIFLEDFKEEIDSIPDISAEDIKQLMDEWKKDYNNIFKKNNPQLIQDINNKIDEFFQLGYDKKTIMMVIKTVFEEKFPKVFFEKNLDNFISNIYDEYVNKNFYGTRE